MNRTLAYIAVAVILAGTAAAKGCDKTPEPRPSDSTLCGTGPDGLIYCQVPAESETPK